MSSWMELYPTISSDIRFTNMLGQPGKNTSNPVKSRRKALRCWQSEAGLSECCSKMKNNLKNAALLLELAFDLSSFFIRINST